MNGVVENDFLCVYLTAERNVHKKDLKKHNKDEKKKEKLKGKLVVSSIHFYEKAKA